MAALRKLAWVEAKLYLRDPLTLVFTLAFPLIMLFVLAGVFGNSTADRDELVYRGLGAIDFYVPAYVGLVAAAVGVVSLPVHLAAYRDQGVFRRLRASGLSVWALIGAEMAVAVTIMAIAGVLVAVATGLAYSNREPGSPLGVLAAFLVDAIAFAGLGFMLGAVLPSARAAQGAGAVLFFTMMLLSGAGPPPEVMTGPMRTIADLLPLTHAIRILQDPWFGFHFQWGALLAVLGFLAGSVAIAARSFRWQ